VIGAPSRSDTDVSEFRGELMPESTPEPTPNVDEMTDAQVQRALLKELYALRARHESFASRLDAIEEAQKARSEWWVWRNGTDKRLEDGRLHFEQLEAPLRAMAEALQDFLRTRGRDDLAKNVGDSMPPPSIEVTHEEFRDEPTSPGQ
jgi:hypothetical protein